MDPLARTAVRLLHHHQALMEEDSPKTLRSPNLEMLEPRMEPRVRTAVRLSHQHRALLTIDHPR